MKKRLRVLCGLVFGLANIVWAVSAKSADFGLESVQAIAKDLAAKPYAARPVTVPESLRRLTYDEYRHIAFDEKQSLWTKEKLPFHLQFFHPGFIQLHTVKVSEVVDGRAAMIPFSPKLFQYRGDMSALGESEKGGGFPADMGFSGLKALYPLNSLSQFAELVVFQGASYFRALSKDARYGLSARGLALNTAEPGGEEFPVFEEFWVQRPKSGDKQLTIWALMDSVSVTGAYQFVIIPGLDTIMEVTAVIYQRPDKAGGVKVFGVAPLTSMFWFGSSSREKHDDLRPQVHDSDGLAIHTGAGEWIWRPLDNPNTIRVATFSDENPRGFGLMQRASDYSDYEDIEAAYHLRPSAWVEPMGDWGRGEVRLVELPTPDETNDNIVAFWTPASLPQAGEPIRMAYRLHWFLDNAVKIGTPATGIAVSTRQGHSLTHESDLRRFWVDFDSATLAKLSEKTEVEAVVTVGGGAKLAHAAAEKNPFTNTWRAAFAIKPDGSGKPVELRCYLKNGQTTLTETWSYLWNP